MTQQTLSVAPGGSIDRPGDRASLRGRPLRRRQSCQSRSGQHPNLRQPIDAGVRLASLTDAHWPRHNSGSPAPRGHSDRRRRIRGVGSGYVRRQPAQIGLDVVKGRLSTRDQIDVDGATVVVADIDAGDDAELEALDLLRHAHRQLAAGRRRYAELRWGRRAPSHADAGGRLLGQAGDARGPGANVRARGASRRPIRTCRRRRSSPFCRRLAAPA